MRVGSLWRIAAVRLAAALLAFTLVSDCFTVAQEAGTPRRCKGPTYAGKSLSEWIQRSRDKDAGVRIEAVRD